MIQLFRKSISVNWMAEQIVNMLITNNPVPPDSSPVIFREYVKFEQCAFLFALVAYSIKCSKINTEDKGPLFASIADSFVQQAEIAGDRATLIDLLKMRLNNYFCEAQFGKNNPTHIRSIDGVAYVNEIAIAGSYFLLLLGIDENNALFIPWHTYNLEAVNQTVAFIQKICASHKLTPDKYKNSLFPSFKTDLHEPLNKQIEDSFRQCQNHEFGHYVLEKFTEGLNCDTTLNGSGPFGCLSNPIPVNGPRGEIKYLAKLRSISGVPIFFQRIGSFNSAAMVDPVDGYEIVDVYGGNWNTLYFDMYHPRRSNFAPAGYVLKPYKPSLAEDPLLGFGVNFGVRDFPRAIPEAILSSSYYQNDEAAPKLAVKAQEYLQKHEFIRPS
ncbi:MAG: hypothetical protein ACREQ5_22355 [Candidatus Dormibacteria bacterium]